jgi:hypothetical protein
MTSLHSLDRLGVEFDDHRVVGDAGLLLPATLMQHLGLEELFREHLDLGDGEAGANVGRKALTVIASVLAGGDCIDDVGALRAAGCEAVLGHECQRRADFDLSSSHKFYGVITEERISRYTP